MTLLKDWQKVLARGSFWLTVMTFTVRLTSLVYLIILARLMPQKEIGMFYLAFSFVEMILCFSDLGLSTTLQRYIPFYDSKRQFGRIRKLMRFYAGVFATLSAVIMLCVYYFRDGIALIFHEPAAAGVFGIMAVYAFVAMLFYVPQTFLISRNRMKEVSLGRIIQDLCKLLITVVFFFAVGLTAGSLTLALLLSFAFGIAYLGWNAYREMGRMPEGKDEKLPIATEILPFGITMVVVSAMLSFAGYMDRIMLGALLEPGTAAVQIGIYAVATGLAALLLTAANSIGTAFLPVVSGLYGKGGKSKEIRESSSLVMKLTLFATMPFFLFFVAFAGDIIRVLYGASYASGAPALIIFCCGIFAVALTNAPRIALAGLRRIGLEFRIGAVGAVSSIAFSIALIPRYGIAGAASASAIAYFLMNGLAYYYARKTFGFRHPPSIWRHALAAALTLGILLAAQPLMAQFVSMRLIASPLADIPFAVLDKLLKVVLLGIAFGIATLIYFTLLSLLRGIEKTEATLFAAALRKARVPSGIVRLISSAMRLSA